MKYIELECGNQKITFNVNYIESIQEPYHKPYGSVIVVNGNAYKVNESYAEICQMLNTKNNN